MSAVERFLRLAGTWADAETELAYREARLVLAREDGVVVTDDELQTGVDDFRAALGLLDVDETEAWLAANELELDDVEHEVEARLLHDKLCASIDRHEVEAEFLKQRIRFDRVRLKVCLAREVAEASWNDAECGWFFRDDLPEAAASRVFRARAGDIVGPVQVDEDVYAVYLVDEFRPAMLDGELERQIRNEIVTARTDVVLNPDDPRRFVLK